MSEWSFLVLALILGAFIIGGLLYLISKAFPGYKDSSTLRENFFQTAIRKFKERFLKK